ncbi:MAG: 3-oxoacyl-acyl-carrier-protein synthase III [Hyphomonadaceae bacterium]|nr:MAG: 3-oxoacyl-acyl-carrier-protein synthase III [Hyphomonadaceae bacterium]KAF0186434.1 MAG: 3-oxoacyl-acyl-carrier-protein synthase III [Hyphomonadaceae bacterium]
MAFTSVLAGLGAVTPSNIVSNEQLAHMIDTSDQWIRERTGIEQRFICDTLETTSSLGLAAAKLALQDANLRPQDIDLIICATSTPDKTFPATATLIQAQLGANIGIAFDIQAVCSGFVYGIGVVDAMLKAGQAKNALLIGADTFSRILDWSDRGTCVLFGDGAGACVLRAVDAEEANGKGVLANVLRADGKYADILNVDSGASSGSRVGKLRMEGQAVFRHAVTNISEAIIDCCAKAGKSVDDIDWFVPHQANKRILDGVARRLNIDEAKIVVTVQMHGNTSAASVPLAFDVAKKDGRIKAGDLVLLEAMGGGLTWGASLIQL